MTRSITNRAVLAVALAVPHLCHAADSSEGDSALEETVVVASRVPTPLNRLGVSVSVTDRESLELLGYSNIGDFLDLQPGVSVTRDGGPGKAAAVRIRGEEGFRTRIILDGIDIADPSSPQVSPRIEHLLSEGLQRIEVLRGPQGLAFGADAGGVISITTRQRASGLAASVAAEGGEDGFSRLGAFVAGGNDRISGSLSVTDLRTDGFNARVSDTVDADRDGYDNTTTHATASYALTDSWSLQGSLHHIDGDNESDGCFDSVTFAVINDCNDDYLQSAWRVALSYEGDRISSTLSYESSSTERDFFSAGLPAFSTEGGSEELSWLAALAIKEGHRIALGVDASEVSIVDGDSEPSRDNLGVWGEYGLDFGRGSITAGARFDDNDDFGQHTSWRVSLHQTLLDGPRPLAIKGAIGTGFRAPSPFEIVYNSGPFSFPASETGPLREETSEGWEVGLLWGDPGQSVELTWFDQKIEDEIYFYFDPVTFYSGYLQDNGVTRSEGLELSGATPLGAGFQVSANLTWNETRSVTGDQRPYRPEWTGAANMLWQGDWLTAALTARFARDSIDTLGEPMPDTERLDASVVAQVSQKLQLTARVENLTDNRDAQIRDYNVQPRAFYVGLRFGI